MSKHETKHNFIIEQELKNRLIKGKRILEGFFKENWYNQKYIDAGRDNLMDLWAVGEAERYVSINKQGGYYKKLSKDDKKAVDELNIKLKKGLKAEAERIFKKYKKS